MPISDNRKDYTLSLSSVQDCCKPMTMKGIPMEHKLYAGAKDTGVSVVPDGVWPGMWRIRRGSRLSDMANLSRARNAAVELAGMIRGGSVRDRMSWRVATHA